MNLSNLELTKDIRNYHKFYLSIYRNLPSFLRNTNDRIIFYDFICTLNKLNLIGAP